MPADVSRTAHAVIIVPEQSITIWDGETTATEASPSAGQPVPTAATQMALTATGDQTADFRVRVQAPGLPRRAERGATTIWREEDDADTLWRGSDPPRSPSGWESILWNDSTIVSVDHLDSVTTETETVICVAQVRDSDGAAGKVYRLEAFVRSPSDGTWSRVLIEGTPTAPSPAWSPCIMVLPSGRVQVYRVFAGVTLNYLRMWYSDDDGATWTHGGDGLRTTVIPTMQRVAYSDGQVALVQRQAADTRLSASSDNGHSFEAVGALPGASPANFDLVARPGGGFVILAIGQDGAAGVDAILLAGAYEAPAQATVVSLPTAFASVSVGEDVAIELDGCGVLQAIARDGDLPMMATSHDGGTTWFSYTSASTTIQDVLDYDSTGSSYPELFTMTPHAGRMLLIHKQASGGTAPSGTTVGAFYLGGWTTRTMPPREGELTSIQSAGWTKVWYPTEVPAAATNWTVTSSGSPTVSFDTLALKISTPVTDTNFYTSPTLTTGNCGFRVALNTTGGSLGFAYVGCRMDLATCTVEVRFAAAGFRIVDGAATTIGDVAVNMSASTYQIWVEVNSTTRVVSSWYRIYGQGPDRQWTVGPSGTLASATPTRNFDWGHITGPAGTVNSWWKEVVIADGNARPRPGNEAIDNPADLRGRLMCGAPYIHSDTRLSARNGPSYRGEEWKVTASADYRLAHAVSTPSPRITWRGTGLTAQNIALQWDTVETPGPQAVLAITLRGNNVPVMTISGHNGSAWVTLASALALTTGTLSYARTGSAVKPGATQDNPYLRHGDYKGSTFCLGTGVGRRIARHGEGKWDSAAALQPVMRLTGVVDGSDPASGADATIIPEQVVILLEDATAYRAIRLEIPAVAGTFQPAETYWEIGSIVVGWAYPIGYESSWGRTLVTELPSEAIVTRDRQQRTVKTAPPIRTMSLAWSDGIDQTDVESDTADPDYVALDTVAGASDVGTGYQLDGIFREIHGSVGELVYMPRVLVLTGTDVFTRRRDAIHCRVTSELTRETVQGDEGVDEVIRISEVTLTEVV